MTEVPGVHPDDSARSFPFSERKNVILVVGATGELGGRVVQLVLEHGHEVRALVRPGTNAATLRQQGVQIVRGDLTDRGSLIAACEAIDVVIVTATAMTARRGAGRRRPTIDDVDNLGLRALIEAAERAGVQRFVYVSSAGLDAALGTPYERAKLSTERRLRASSMSTVIVRPDAFQETHLAPPGQFDIARGRVVVFGAGNARTRWVSLNDVAALIAAVAVETDPPDLIEFGGPEALSRNETIAIAERLTGRRIKRQHIPRPVMRLAISLLARPHDGLASALGLLLMRDLNDSNWDDSSLRQRGIAPKSASQFLREQARNLGIQSEQ